MSRDTLRIWTHLQVEMGSWQRSEQHGDPDPVGEVRHSSNESHQVSVVQASSWRPEHAIWHGVESVYPVPIH